jgi:phosphoglycerate dehydrogenase-like enzyme
VAPSRIVKPLTVLEFIRDQEGVWTLPARLIADLALRHPGVRFESPSSRAAAERLLPGADVVYGVLVDAENFHLARRLRWIHVSSAGVGSLIFPALAESEVVLTNGRGLHAVSMAEHALGLMLAFARKLHLARDLQRERRWEQVGLWTEPPPFGQLAGGTLGLVGLGAVGSALAERAVALGLRVIAVRPHPARDPRPAHEQWGLARLPELLERADWVVLAAPHTDATRGLIGAAELARMRPGAVLVNLGRGALVDEPALVTALRAGLIAGAALDVVRGEPLAADSPLWDLPNVILTPHVSGLGPGYWERAVEQFAGNLECFLAGRPLLNVVDKRVGY